MIVTGLNLDQVFPRLVETLGPDLVFELVLYSENPEWAERFAVGVPGVSADQKKRLAELVIERGQWWQAYYFVRLVRGIPDEMVERLLDAARVRDPKDRAEVRLLVPL